MDLMRKTATTISATTMNSNVSAQANAFPSTGSATSMPIAWTDQMKVRHVNVFFTFTYNLLQDLEMCISIYPNCTSKEFQCQNRRCIDNKYVCDMEDNCRDGSDELNCGSKSPHCKEDEFQCGNGDCILAVWRCDGQSV